MLARSPSMDSGRQMRTYPKSGAVSRGELPESYRTCSVLGLHLANALHQFDARASGNRDLIKRDCAFRGREVNHTARDIGK